LVETHVGTWLRANARVPSVECGIGTNEALQQNRSRIAGRRVESATRAFSDLARATPAVWVGRSDGLSKMVPYADIANLLKQSPTAEAACQALVGAALNNGGKDNVTVVLARYAFQ